MLKALSLLLLVFLFTSCGSIKKPVNIIPVDSLPRGARVLDENGKTWGKTPFFYKIKEPFWSEEFTFELDGMKQKSEYGCSLNWAQSLVPTSLLMTIFPVGTVVGTGFLTIDWVQGGIYRCHKPLEYHFKKTSQLKENSKKVFLPLPIFMRDEKKSDKIASFWHKKIFKSDRDQVIDPIRIKDDLFYYGIHHLKNNLPGKLKKRYLWELGYKYKATHLIYFKVEKNKRGVKIIPTFYDIFTLKEVEIPEYKKDFIFRKDEDDYLSSKILDAINFIPNALILSFKETEEVGLIRNNQDVLPETIGVKNHPDAFPQYLTAFGFDTVNHPQFFDTWDYSFDLFPTFAGSSWQASVGNDSIRFQNYAGFYNAGLTLHTYIGAASLAIGYGLSYLLADADRAKEIDKFSGVLRTAINYVAFFNDRFYFKAEVTHNNLSRGKVEFFGLEVDSWSDINVGLGYYFPSLRSLARRMLWF